MEALDNSKIENDVEAINQPTTIHLEQLKNAEAISSQRKVGATTAENVCILFSNREGKVAFSWPWYGAQARPYKIIKT
jgi:hypothetical protein